MLRNSLREFLNMKSSGSCENCVYSVSSEEITMSELSPTIPFNESLQFIVAISAIALGNDNRWFAFMKSTLCPYWESDSEQLIQDSIELQTYAAFGYLLYIQQQFGPSFQIPADVIKIIKGYVVVPLAIIPVRDAKPSWLPQWKLSKWESLIWAEHPKNEFHFFWPLNDDDDPNANSQLSTYPLGGRFRLAKDGFHEGEIWGEVHALEGELICALL